MTAFTPTEVEEALRFSKTPYKFEPHSFIPMPKIGKNRCYGCGLLALRNSLTLWAIKRGCNFSDAPGYKAALKRLT